MKTFQKILLILILQIFCFQQNIFAQDTIPVKEPLEKPVKIKFRAEPLKATMLAVAFPGLGQVYNRKIWKIPLVYAGFGALIYSAGINSSNYNKYMKAYQDFTDTNPATDSYLKLIAADPAGYDPILYPKTAILSSTSYYKDGMLRMVDYYKRYRDLSYIGIAGWYMLSILDANVDASLFNYDITDNLDIAVFPIQVPLPGGYIGAGLNIGLKVVF
ncbi:MAG: hypothetical protein EPN88_06560 [Bacteroidetes bacterium]|nr:MAG: hypothetical protein EPN88_06560 [Bacteroidota bacterium]